MSIINMNPMDMNYCIRRLPKIVRETMKTEGSKLLLGGGFVRSCITREEVNDIDLFVDSYETEDRIIKLLKTSKDRLYITRNATTILRESGVPIQIIHRWMYKAPEDLIYDFDFSICCAVIWYSDEQPSGVVHGRYYQDLAAKRLVYMQPTREEEAGGSILRVLKYYRKGYTITLDSFGSVIAKMMSNVDMKKTGVELEKVITGLLVEVDPHAILGNDVVQEHFENTAGD